MIIHDDVSSYRPSAWFYDAENGAGWLIAKSHGTLVAKTPYGLTWDETGYLTMAVPSTNGVLTHIVLPHKAAVADDVLKFQVVGYISAMVTPSLSLSAGHAFDMDTNGAVADAAADPDGTSSEFALSTAATTTATTHNAWLFGVRITIPS